MALDSHCNKINTNKSKCLRTTKKPQKVKKKYQSQELSLKPLKFRKVFQESLEPMVSWLFHEHAYHDWLTPTCYIDGSSFAFSVLNLSGGEEPVLEEPIQDLKSEDGISDLQTYEHLQHMNLSKNDIREI